MESIKGKAKMYFLKGNIVKMWENRKLKKTWLNYLLKVPYILGVSGNYSYWIRVSNPKQVKFSVVPEFYQKCVNPKRKIYEYNAVFEKKETREIRTKKKEAITLSSPKTS